MDYVNINIATFFSCSMIFCFGLIVHWMAIFSFSSIQHKTPICYSHIPNPYILESIIQPYHHLHRHLHHCLHHNLHSHHPSCQSAIMTTFLPSSSASAIIPINNLQPLQLSRLFVFFFSNILTHVRSFIFPWSFHNWMFYLSKGSQNVFVWWLLYIRTISATSSHGRNHTNYRLEHTQSLFIANLYSLKIFSYREIIQ